MPVQEPETFQAERRGFFKKAAAIVMGTVAALVPGAAGLAVFLDPLRRRREAAGFVRVTTLEALPADGIPRRFAVVSSRVDAWNHHAQTPVGAVYLRRTGEHRVEALSVVCPHAGCFVDYRAGSDQFICPCHDSAFGLDGSIAEPRSPSPRPMDSLEVELRHQTEVWVRYQQFHTGSARRVPKA